MLETTRVLQLSSVAAVWRACGSGLWYETVLVAKVVPLVAKLLISMVTLQQEQATGQVTQTLKVRRLIAARLGTRIKECKVKASLRG